MTRNLTVETLLDMYDQYKTLLAARAPLEQAAARVRLVGAADPDAQTELDSLNAALATLSDAMTFDLPSIWIRYKFLAYQHEAQPILTLSDLRQHCSKPGYICTKRYTFLVDAMHKKGIVTLDSATLDPQLRLDDAQITTLLALVEADDHCMQQWRDYEYFTRDGRAAKWEIYDTAA
jgi:hypothetical protein